jgi:PPOX class probable F420-dependent enzyme
MRPFGDLYSFAGHRSRRMGPVSSDVECSEVALMAGGPQWWEGGAMTTLDDVAELGRREQGLFVVSTLRADLTIQSSLVNAGVMEHPLTGAPVLALVTYGPVKLRNLRARPRITATVRSGWQWATVEGPVDLIGPDDPDPAVDAERLRLLLRGVFVAAGGTHDDWDAYDRTMAAERRTAVLIRPDRVYSNR